MVLRLLCVLLASLVDDEALGGFFGAEDVDAFLRGADSTFFLASSCFFGLPFLSSAFAPLCLIGFTGVSDDISSDEQLARDLRSSKVSSSLHS